MDNKTVFPGWNYVMVNAAGGPRRKRLGSGGYGSVYEIQKEDNPEIRSALKEISVPQDQSDLREYIAEGMSKSQILQVLEDEKNSAEEEIKRQIQVMDNPNIVRIEDYAVREKATELGWDIFIKMELLTPLDGMKAGTLTQDEVRKLGIDICSALEECHGVGMLHRDIKPGNIFVDGEGNYKLGDFGISRILKETSGIISKTGTEKYAAPEVIRMEKNRVTSDIYSLGMVMYELLNGGRLPFLPPASEVIRLSDREEAMQKRLDGESIEPIDGVSDDLNQIVIQACNSEPRLRFLSATAMKEKLQGKAGKTDRKSRKKSVGRIIALPLLIVVIAIAFYLGFMISQDGSLENVPLIDNTEDTTSTEEVDITEFPVYDGPTVRVSNVKELKKELGADGSPLNMATADNKTIEIESGNYDFTMPLEINADHVKLVGVGHSKPVLNCKVEALGKDIMLENICVDITDSKMGENGEYGILFFERGYLKNVDVKVRYSSDFIIFGVSTQAPIKMEGCNINVNYGFGESGNAGISICDDYSINNCTIESNSSGIDIEGVLANEITEEEKNELRSNNSINALDDIWVDSAD